MRSKNLLIGLLSLAVISSSSHFSTADSGCDRNCLERLTSQIQVLREEVKGAIPVGTIVPFAGRVLPAGYIICDGRWLSQNDEEFSNLFVVIAHSFSTEQERQAHPGQFKVPNLLGRTVVGDGQGSGLSIRTLGDLIGTSETHTLTVADLPSHDHGVSEVPHKHAYVDNGHSHSYSKWTAGDRILLKPDNSQGYGTHIEGSSADIASGPSTANIEISATSTNITILKNGGSEPFSIMQPSLVLRYIIKAN